MADSSTAAGAESQAESHAESYSARLQGLEATCRALSQEVAQREQTLSQAFAESSAQNSSKTSSKTSTKTSPPDQTQELAKELGQLRARLTRLEGERDLLRRLKEATSLADAEDDLELAALAREERDSLVEQLAALTAQNTDNSDDENRGAILEIRAGAGGEEAALFAGVLARMYRRYAETHGWDFEELSLSQNDLGGLREGVFALGAGAARGLRFESGVHRVQRVPVTEAGGRIHTSTATVAVLPEVREVELEIKPQELRIDTYRAGGAGGQHVNRTDSAVRITHLPTGIVAQCQDEKSQHRNRAQAMAVLRARLFDRMQEQARTAEHQLRRGQVGSGDRSERIRTYNYPQNRVTDHRIGFSLRRLDAVLEGEALAEVFAALHKAEVAEAAQLEPSSASE